MEVRCSSRCTWTTRSKSKWRRGLWVGKSELNDTAFVATKTGVVVGRSVKVLSDDQLVADDLLNMVGVP